MKTALVGALAAGGLVCATGSADAYSATRVPLRTSHGVGVYAAATSAAKKVGDDVLPGYGNAIWAMCWQVGQNVGNAGDVWYDTVEVEYNGPGFPNVQYFTDGTAWTFAPYVDGAAAFHNGLPQCPQSIPS
ncbi:hypothetical protein DN069_16385 [Streptacidiphilus pinicola]|uniref:Uncharacterized protein n=1 Tax=Streptacidiphilus pinicola TaxID=2219663 RepID=A0A2X0IIU1_9ACTN|nr:hypothetical protein [Streptacidiphilus pinicola]RAG84547.1 hypothetical protein DN069_16385 [Streptacidiphilus pinicola]